MDSRFHISLPCMHVGATVNFYTKIIGATTGRKSKNWVDINLFNHQLTFAKSGKFHFEYPSYLFEKTVLPAFHFGVILEVDEWKRLYEKLKSNVHIDLTTYLLNENGEHQSFFLKDPNGYVIEFKCFKNTNNTFIT